MTDPFRRNPVKIPVRLVDGRWEFFYGGGVPVPDGSVGELVVDKESIGDPEFLDKLQRKTDYKIFEVGTELLVALTVKSTEALDEPLKQELIGLNDRNYDIATYGNQYYFSPNTAFVRVYVWPPTEINEQYGTSHEGGVWLRIEGLQPKSLISGAIKIPVQDEPADSLNHAFTLLSEKYEPWRKAHTGSIYRQIYYQEQNGKWYPLDILRKATEAEDEHQFVHEQWVAIAESLNLDTNRKD